MGGFYTNSYGGWSLISRASPFALYITREDRLRQRFAVRLSAGIVLPAIPVLCILLFKGTLCDVRRLASEFSRMKEAVCMKIYDIVVLVIMILSLIIQVLSFLLK